MFCISPKKVATVLFLISAVTTQFSGLAEATSAMEMEYRVDSAVKRFYKEIDEGKELAKKSKGMLIFPSIIKAGIGIGGEYGEGALRVKGKTVGYYSTAAASVGFQLGVQTKTVIILFMTKKSYKRFLKSDRWKAGVDGSVAIAKNSAAGAIDTKTIQKPIIGFVFGNKGLMFNLTIEGSRIDKIDLD